MATKPNLRIVRSNDDLLRELLKVRDDALAVARRAEADMVPLRRVYADERGEFLPPSYERLRLELGDALQARAGRVPPRAGSRLGHSATIAIAGRQ